VPPASTIARERWPKARAGSVVSRMAETVKPAASRPARVAAGVARKLDCALIAQGAG
jgi:hypothetical protein